MKKVVPVLFLTFAALLVHPGVATIGDGFGGGSAFAASRGRPLSKAAAKREAMRYIKRIRRAQQRGRQAEFKRLRKEFMKALQDGGRLSNLPVDMRERMRRGPGGGRSRRPPSIEFSGQAAPPAIPAQPAQPGLTKEDVAEIVEKAVRGVVAEKEKKATPEPAAIKSDVDHPSYATRVRKHDFAIVVGVEEYPDLPHARFAKRDAQSVREHLVALGFPERNVILLTGYRASRSGLVKNLETWLPNNVKKKSRVFFYYSGHGAPDPETGEAYLLPFDGDPAYLKDTAYPLKRLYASLGRLKAKTVIVVLDACFSGAGGRSVIAKGTRPLVTKIESGFDSSDKITALTASAGDQISGSIEKEGHGLFTYYFLKGLNGGAEKKGKVTLRGLFDYLSPKVQDAARRDNRSQTPQFKGAQEDLKLR